MKLELVKVPNPLLKQKSKTITVVDDEIKKLIDDMIETMYEDKGIGLSAIQVGKLLRLVVIDIRDKGEEKKNPQIFINPVITKFSDEKEYMDKVEELAYKAFEDQCTTANPKLPLIEDLKQILIDAYYGE